MTPTPHDGSTLPAIPVLATGPDFPLETLLREQARAHALLDAATHRIPLAALRSLDSVSRRWILRSGDPDKLAELDQIAGHLARPGAYFLSVNYEWGCTVCVTPDEAGEAARLVRVLDWRTRGLGRYAMAVEVAGRAGPFVTLTWPGYTGVLQAVAPGRFAAALNQAPMRSPIGVMPLDWAANRVRIWNRPHLPPAHLLRQAFDTAPSYAAARRLLTETPIAAPCIYSLAGLDPRETCIIERTEQRAQVFEGRSVAANHWQTPGWPAGRMHGVAADLDAESFNWLTPPILNPNTRLVMIAEAMSGRLIAQGFEADGPATAVLRHTARSLVPA